MLCRSTHTVNISESKLCKIVQELVSTSSARTGITRDKHWPPRGACRCRRQVDSGFSSSSLLVGARPFTPHPSTTTTASLSPLITPICRNRGGSSRHETTPPPTRDHVPDCAARGRRRSASRSQICGGTHHLPLHARGSFNGICNALRWAQWPRHGLFEMFGDGIGASGSCWPHTKKFLGLTFPNSREPRPSSTPSPAAMPPTRRHRPPRYERITMDEITWVGR